MEMPWPIVRRVLDVGPPGDGDDLHADAEEHGMVVDAEADAQAQEEQHAGVREGEEHDVAAEDAAVEAHAQHDAVAEAEEDAQAQEKQHATVAEAQAEADAQAQEEQHAVVEEAEEHDAAAEDAAIEAQIQLEESVVDVNTNIMVSQAAHAMMVAAGGGPDFTITVARPPRVSSLFAGHRSHPDPQRPDMYGTDAMSSRRVASSSMAEAGASSSGAGENDETDERYFGTFTARFSLRHETWTNEDHTPQTTVEYTESLRTDQTNTCTRLAALQYEKDKGVVLEKVVGVDSHMFPCKWVSPDDRRLCFHVNFSASVVVGGRNKGNFFFSEIVGNNCPQFVNACVILETPDSSLKNCKFCSGMWHPRDGWLLGLQEPADIDNL